MASFFVQTPEDARRHVNLLASSLKKVALAGLIGGAGCGVLAVLLGHFLVPPSVQSTAIPGTRELSGISFVTWFMTIGLLVFSALYFISGWGLSQQKSWARYTAAGTFIFKVLLCVWLGRGSIGAMFVFLMIAGWDVYGLWVLLSKGTAQVFSSPQVNSGFDSPTTKPHSA
jgi:hypothetical protein